MPRYHASIPQDDNRDHLVCLQCGREHIKLYGDEDDTNTQRGGYQYHNINTQPSDLAVCELLPQPEVGCQHTIQYVPVQAGQDKYH